MARPLWTGSISFGLVTIPVSIVPALESTRVSFHQLHDKDNARLQRRMICPAENQVVHPEHIQRGYEYAPNKYVVVLQSEIESIEPKRSRTIEITDFVSRDDVDPVYYDRPYYLASAGADRPYRLLVEALHRTRKAGIAQFVMRARQYLCAIESIDGALCLMLLHYADSITEPPSAPATSANELVTSCESIISRMKRDSFDPSQYGDTYQERVIALIERKRNEQAIVHAPETGAEETPPPDIAELLAALEESVEQARRQRQS